MSAAASQRLADFDGVVKMRPGAIAARIRALGFGYEDRRRNVSEVPVHYLPLSALWRLNHAVGPVAASFNAYGCYLVGSALERKDWRDVDVRLIMADSKFDRMFTTKHGRHLWTLICVTVSEHLSSVTGLPIDFQPQRQSDNDNAPGKFRHPLGKTEMADHYSAAVPAAHGRNLMLRGSDD